MPTNDYDVFAPWNTPGWTPLNGVPLIYSDSGIPQAQVDWPTDLVIVTVVGTFLSNDGYQINGVVRFTNTKQFRIGDVTINPGEVVGVVREGALEVDLPASNDPAYSEAFVYDVKECWPGGRKYRITVPFDSTLPDLFELETEDTNETVSVDESTALRIVQEATFTKTFGYFQTNGTPVPGLAGYTARFVIRPAVDEAPVYEDNAVPFNTTTAVVSLTISSVDTGLLDTGRLVYGLELVSPDLVPIVIPLVSNGAVLVSPSVS